MTPPTDANGLPAGIGNITPGTQLMVTLGGLDSHLKTTFVGLERGRYVLFRTPQRNPHNGVYEYLYSGNETKVSFLFEGSLFSFASRVQSFTATPYPLVFVDFPERIESHNLRKEHRVECSFPVQAKCGNRICQAMIMDLSRNGCSLAMPLATEDPAPQPGDTLYIESPLFGATGETRIKSQVRRMKAGAAATASLGLTFDNLPSQVDQWIENYVAQVIGLFSN